MPWAWVAPYEGQAQRNHRQSLEVLAQRGGLSPAELHEIVHGHSLRAIFERSLTDEEAESWLAQWDGRPGTLEPVRETA